MKNKITQQDIDEIIKNGTLTVETIGEKTTMVRFVTKDGYEIIETSACVDKANYNEAIASALRISSGRMRAISSKKSLQKQTPTV